MRCARLGRGGPEVSVVALGCGNFGGIGSLPELVGHGDDEAVGIAAAGGLAPLTNLQNNYSLGAYPRGSRMTLRPDLYRHLERPGTFAALAKLERAAADRGVDLATLALAWVLADPGVSAVIVGPRRPEQLEPALAALEVSLFETERAKLTEPWWITSLSHTTASTGALA